MTLRLVLAVKKVLRVTCPKCGKAREVPDDCKPGDLIVCCGQPQKLTEEFGQLALEEVF